MNISDVFIKKIWKGRFSEFPNRRKLVPTEKDNVYDVERHEGEVFEEGDIISEQELNDFERRVYNGFEKIISNCDQIEIQYKSDDFLEPGGWEDMIILPGKSKIGLLFSHLSTAVKNLRYLYKLLGTTYISTLSDGTVTGAITQLYSEIAMINNVVFPDTRSWLSDQWNLIKDAAMNVSVVKNSSQAKITAESTPGIGSNLAAHLRSPLIDLTYFNALTISGKAYVKENHRTDNYLSPKVFLMNSLGNKVKTLYVYPEQTTGDKTINVTYDISDIEGRCSIDLELMIYAWADAVFGVGNYVSLTGCELSR